jgi:hypothetical protein
MFVLGQILLSRLVYLAGGVLTIALLDEANKDSLTLGEFLARAPDTVRILLFNADSIWYQTIVRSGYDPGPFSLAEQQNWAFFPLFPALIRLTGGSIVAGVLLANLALLAAGLLLSYEIRRAYGRTAARWTLLLLLFAPMSGVLSAYRPDSLVLLASVAAWVAARHERWWLAWLAVAFAVLARPTGALAALLVLGPLLASIRADGWSRAALLRLAGVCLPIGALVAFSAYLGLRTGNPMAWQAIQAVWGRTFMDPFTLVHRYVTTDPILVHWRWDFVALGVVVLLAGCATGVALLLRRQWSLGAFVLAGLLVSPITGGTTQALARYATTLFPIYMEVATDRKVRRIRLAVLVAMTALLALVGAWVALDVKAAMA